MSLNILVTLLNKKLYIRQAWLLYCLISPSSWPNNFYVNDCFRETIIKLCKKKVKFNQFLQEVLAPNVIWLWKTKKVMTCVIKSTSHSNCYSIVNSGSDFSLIVKLLVEDAVFDYQPGRRRNKSEFINLYSCRTKSIAAKVLFDLY